MQTVSPIAELGDNRVDFFLSQAVASAAVKEGLKQIRNMRSAIRQTAREMTDRSAKLKAITDDQVRLRANLKEMPATAAPHKRTSTNSISKRPRSNRSLPTSRGLQNVELSQKTALDQFLVNFTAE